MQRYFLYDLTDRKFVLNYAAITAKEKGEGRWQAAIPRDEKTLLGSVPVSRTLGGVLPDNRHSTKRGLFVFATQEAQRPTTSFYGAVEMYKHKTTRKRHG